MSHKIFKIQGYPRTAVQAGTTVRLEALLNDGLVPDGRDEKVPNGWLIDWTIQGPRTDDIQERKNGGPKIDFEPGVPGAYAVTAHKYRPKDKGGEGEPADDDINSVLGLGNPSRGDVPKENDVTDPWEITVTGSGVVSPAGTVPVSLQRTGVTGTLDQLFWTIIRNRTNAISFRRYKQFIDGVMCGESKLQGHGHGHGSGGRLNFTGTQAYEVLKQATDAFLMQECGIVVGAKPEGFLHPDLMEAELGSGSPEAQRFLEQEPRRYNRSTPLTVQELQAMRSLYYEQLRDDGAIALPYLKIIREKLSEVPLKKPGETVPNCYGILRSRLEGPLAMELIWSYWHEEGMLVQTLNAILARFQNRRLSEGRDPLARLNLDPLRPLANVFWAWGENELQRLTVRRRAFEYDNEYGLTLLGKAMPQRRTADSRSRFLESFHTLLHSCHLFFKEDDDTTVLADGFPLLNALRETHLILSEGAHNQFGDLPSTARGEMMIMQWLLARPEMREFLGGRVMVPYEEEWMDRVDSMKQIQGWGDTTVTHTRDLGVFGEQILLGIRYGNWSVINDPQQAANWARYWRPEIQRYLHAYRATTGINLTERVDATVPAYLLQRRLASQQRASR